jgi:tRNA dimethylallyltransferase
VGRALNAMASPEPEKRELRNPDREPLLVVVLGPTASGKTALALAIARRFRGEIVNCDSVAMYREFDIGTAKPTAAERAEIPHHLLDCVDPVADVSAGEYARQARLIVREIASRGTVCGENGQRRNLPIVSGGTGLYLRALLDGLFAGPQRSEELRSRLRARADKHGAEHLHRILRRLDAAAAKRIHAHDIPKVIRAIEVCLGARRTSPRTSPGTSAGNMTELWQQGREALRGFRILRFGLNPDREALYARINQRAAKMFDEGRTGGGRADGGLIDGGFSGEGLIAEGLIAETERLLAKYGDKARPLTSLGYRQAVQFLRGELDRDPALAAAQQAHRNYAKRQMTWFRREPDVHWLAGFGDDPAIQAETIAIIEPEV